MVYKGKPSPGCGTCRQRRIRCDLERPICSQCIKSKRECTGYRSHTDLLFRDQTEKTELKLRQQRSEHRNESFHGRARSEPESGPSLKSQPVTRFNFNLKPLDPERGHDTGWTKVSRDLPVFYEHQALCYFITQYVIIPQHHSDRGHLDFLLPLYIEAKSPNPLLASTAATSLAVFSKRTGQEWLMGEAWNMYGSALILTQKASRDPVEAKSDTTLMAVMLLGLFETVTATEASFPDWGPHTDGAVALVKLRGKEMLDNPVSSKLLGDVCAQSVISQISRCEPVKEIFCVLENWGFSSGQDSQSIANKLTIITTKIPDLRQKGKRLLQDHRMSWSTAHAISALMVELQNVDRELTTWVLDLPQSWRYTILPEGSQSNDSHSAQLYPGSVHDYPDLWVAGQWNTYRTHRILCQSLIFNCLERLIPPAELKSTKEYFRTTTSLQRLANEICASVPFHLGHPFSVYTENDNGADFLEDFSRDDYDVPSFKPESSDHSPNTKAIGGYLLIWHLFVAESIVTIPESQRAWIANRLRHIGESYGLNQANELANQGLQSLDKGRQPSITDFAPARDLAWEDYGGIYWRRILGVENTTGSGTDSA